MRIFRPWDRLVTALIFLNGVGLFACVMLMAAAVSKNDVIVTEQLTQSVQLSFRMFIAGGAVPAAAWGITALEMNRSRKTIKLLESAIIYFLVMVSLVLFVIAAWRLPGAIISLTQAETHLHNYGDLDNSCQQWTDGCRNCSRGTDGAPVCSNIGVVCQPGEVKCTERPGDAPK
jgi:hypothetical protein